MRTYQRDSITTYFVLTSYRHYCDLGQFSARVLQWDCLVTLEFAQGRSQRGGPRGPGTPNPIPLKIIKDKTSTQ